MTKKKYPLKCSICGEKVDIHPLSGWADGHNAQPINDGRCCTLCNDMAVLPERIRRLMLMRRTESSSENGDR